MTDTKISSTRTLPEGRNRNMDIVRSIALVWVMVYHIWFLTDSHITNPVLSTFVTLGGEIGVTVFFILSGYGIFHSLDHMCEKEGIHFLPFMRNRLIRVLPEYYLSLIVLLFFTPQALTLSKAGLPHVILHFFFLHNISPEMAGSINGALWTMAVIVQFYLVSIPMYHLLRKTKHLFPVLFIGITLGFKIVCFHYLSLADDFWISRQLLPSVIDNFALGMFTAWLMKRKPFEKTNRAWFNLTMIILSFFLLYLICRYGQERGIHSDTLSGYVWHTLVALSVCLGCFFYGRWKLNGVRLVRQPLLWIAKYEYGIYIVHLVLIVNLLECSTILQELSTWPVIRYVLFMALSLFFGWLLSVCADPVRALLFGRSGNHKIRTLT